MILSTAFKVEALRVTVVCGLDQSWGDSELRKVQSQIVVGVGISWANPLDLRLMLLGSYTVVPHFSDTSVMDIPLAASQKFITTEATLDSWEASLWAVRKLPGPKGYAVELFCRDHQAYISVVLEQLCSL